MEKKGSNVVSGNTDGVDIIIILVIVLPGNTDVVWGFIIS